MQAARRQVRDAQLLAQLRQMDGHVDPGPAGLIGHGAMHTGEGLDAAGKDADGGANGWVGKSPEITPQQRMQRREGVQEPMVRLPRGESSIRFGDRNHDAAPMTFL